MVEAVTMEQSQLITPRQSLTLDLPPSCIEFCPAHPDYFVVGTYNLQKTAEAPSANGEAAGSDDDDPQAVEATPQSQNRNGSLVVFQLAADGIRHVQTLLQPSAILDLHFHPSPEKHNVLAVVSSTGTLCFFRLEPRPVDGTSVELAELATHRPLGEDGSTLFLSCCWHPLLADLIAVTTSTHEVHIFRVDESWTILPASETPIMAHELEAWTVAFSPAAAPYGSSEHTSVAQGRAKVFTTYSGGDDSMLLQHSCLYRPDSDEENGVNNDGGDDDDDDDDDDDGDDEDGDRLLLEAAYPVFKHKGHGAGVTAILPLEVHLTGLDRARVVVTGSYDDHIRVFACYEMGQDSVPLKARFLAEANLGGGVWRLKLVSLSLKAPATWEAVILASCMHAGSRVLRLLGDQNGECQVQVDARFEAHQSMNYGSDFHPSSGGVGASLRCVSTSFYDKLMCLWEVTL